MMKFETQIKVLLHGAEVCRQNALAAPDEESSDYFKNQLDEWNSAALILATAAGIDLDDLQRQISERQRQWKKPPEEP